MINNRQNGRRRGRGGQQRVPGSNPGRPESGNRIDSRARGNASQLYEKYKTLAGDAQRQGDRVNTEYYLQFADHYFRVLAESRPRPDEQQARGRGQSEFDDEFDGDGEDYGQEGESAQPDQYQPRADDRYRQDSRSNQDGRQGQGQGQGQDRQNQDRQSQDRQPQEDRPRQQSRQETRPDDRPRRDDRPRQDNRHEARQEGRQDGRQESQQDVRSDQPRQDQPRQDQPRQDQLRQDQPRQDQLRQDDRPRRDRPRRDGAQERPREERNAGVERMPEQPAADVPAVVDQAPQTAEVLPMPLVRQEASIVRVADIDAPVPRRRGRPPKVRPPENVVATPAETSGFDADRLPPSLSVPASAASDAGEPADKPRRRRRIVSEPVEAGSAS